MRKSPYHRYALMDNPFKFGWVGSIYHVKQEEDYEIEDMYYDVIERNRKVFLQIIGEKGLGKTERLLLLVERAKEEGRSYCYINGRGKNSTQVILEILDAISKFKRRKLFIKPSWLKKIKKLKKRITKEPIDFEMLSDVIPSALNECSPCFLLLDEPPIENELFILLKEVFDRTSGGLFIAVTTERKIDLIPEKIELRGFSERESELFVAKRLLSERSTGDKLDPLYPFTADAIHYVNKLVNGNPKKLLEKMANILELGVSRRVGLIDKDFVARVVHKNDRVKNSNKK